MLGEVQFRQGAPWLAADSAIAALKLDPCYPRAHLLEFLLLEINSNRASAAKHLNLAHTLDPDDPLIRTIWLIRLPLAQRISEIQTLINADTGKDPDDLKKLKSQLDDLQKLAAEPQKACTLVSNTATSSMPFSTILYDATHVRNYGLEVKINDYPSNLNIITSGGGIEVSRSVADHAGLKRIQSGPSSATATKGTRAYYTAYADDLKIGQLEFRDCTVTVLEKGDVLGMDGTIGTGVFSQFLVTLDYPARKMLLGPLPPRPDETAPIKQALETTNSTGTKGIYESTAPAQFTVANPAIPILHDRYMAPEMKDWTSFYHIGSSMIIPTLLNDSTQVKLFILSTGTFATVVSPEAAREISKIHPEDMTIRTIGGDVGKVYFADQITLHFATSPRSTATS